MHGVRGEMKEEEEEDRAREGLKREEERSLRRQTGTRLVRLLVHTYTDAGTRTHTLAERDRLALMNVSSAAEAAAAAAEAAASEAGVRLSCPLASGGRLVA